MTTLLLCNIGTRDVQWPRELQFPPEALAPNKEGALHTSPRTTGKYILDDWSAYEKQLTLAMLDKAIQHINVPPTELVVHMFASDQPPTVPAHLRNGDTVFFAEIAKKLLKIPPYSLGGKSQVQIHTNASNPADYDLMHELYVTELHKIHQRVGLDRAIRVYLLLAGGTPAMNTMLLLAGNEVFGVQAYPLYVAPDRPAMELDINRQLAYRTLTRSLHEIFQAYGYTTALRLIDNQQQVLPSDQHMVLLTSLLSYAEARRNFDWRTASLALRPALAKSRELRPFLQQLNDEVAQETTALQLRDTIFLAEVAIETGDWADFLARLHRFSEGSLQLLAEQVGVEWSDSKSRASYKAQWWNQHRAALHQLGMAAADPPPESKSENTAREADRANLARVVGYFGADDPATVALLAQLAVIGVPVGLRNRIVHDFKPISRAEIEAKGKTISTLLNAMRQSYELQFAQPVAAEHPYIIINQLCERILAGEK